MDVGTAPDPFALLGIAPIPSPDPALLAERLRTLSARFHPDRSSDPASTHQFAEIRRAGQLLTDPAQRIRCLLEMAGLSPAKPALPPSLATPFSTLGAILQQARDRLRPPSQPRSAIAAALHQQQMSDLAHGLEAAIQPLVDRFNELEHILQQLNSTWDSDRDATLLRLADLHPEILFLSRWLATAREIHFQLSR